MKKILFIFSIILFFIFGNYLFLEKDAVGAIIDFEAGPANPNPFDTQEINIQYQALSDGGVTFSTTSGDPRLEAVGGPFSPQFPSPPGDVLPGFINDDLNLHDTEATNIPQSLGNYFLRLGTGDLQAGTVPTLLIDYMTPVSAASAEIWDIDATSVLGTEQWKVTAYDQLGGAGQLLGTMISPLGLADPLDPDYLDGKPWFWFFDLGTGNFDIRSIQIQWYTNNPLASPKTSGIGLAFDNFNTTAVPIPGAIWLFGSGILGMVFMRRKLKN